MEKLRKKWCIIRDEGLKQIKESKINSFTRSPVMDPTVSLSLDGWVRGWTGDPLWLNYGLIYNSKFMKKNCKKCPKTYNLLRKVFNKEKIIMAGFSLLKPHSSIPPHIDEKTSIKYRVFHIGLSIPDTRKCVLIVNGKIENQENGKLIQFDDSIKHSAFNATSEDRLILYVKCK